MKTAARVLAVVAALALPVSGCAGKLPPIQTLVNDINSVAGVLNMIASFAGVFFAAHPDPGLQSKVDQKVAQVQALLVATEQSLQGASDLDQGNVDAAFAELKTAYSELLELVQSLGVRVGSPGGRMGASPGGLTVPPPDAIVPRLSLLAPGERGPGRRWAWA